MSVNIVKVLPNIDAKGYNIGDVYAASVQLFSLQEKKYWDAFFSGSDKQSFILITSSGRN